MLRYNSGIHLAIWKSEIHSSIQISIAISSKGCESNLSPISPYFDIYILIFILKSFWQWILRQTRKGSRKKVFFKNKQRNFEIRDHLEKRKLKFPLVLNFFISHLCSLRSQTLCKNSEKPNKIIIFRRISIRNRKEDIYSSINKSKMIMLYRISGNDVFHPFHSGSIHEKFIHESG